MLQLEVMMMGMRMKASARALEGSCSGPNLCSASQGRPRDYLPTSVFLPASLCLCFSSLLLFTFTGCPGLWIEDGRAVGMAAVRCML
jgi:hypothetical protein